MAEFQELYVWQVVFGKAQSICVVRRSESCSLASIVYILVLWIVTTTAVDAQAQSGVQSTTVRNLTVLDSLARKTSRALAEQVKAEQVKAERVRQFHTTQDTLRYVFATHAASWMLDQYVLTDNPALKRFRTSDSGKGRILSLRMIDFAVRYFLVETDDDALAREASIIVSASIEEPSGAVRQLTNISYQQRDTITRRAVPLLESRQYEFANGIVPEPPGGFMKSVVEPLVVIAAAVIALVLLFTVRTQ